MNESNFVLSVSIPLRQDMQSWWALFRGKDDQNTLIGIGSLFKTSDKL